MQYDKTGDIDDLLVLIDNAYGKNEKSDLQNYLSELISHKDFNRFCNAENENLAQNQMKTEEYYSGFYATVLFDNGYFDNCLSFSRSYVNTMGYTEFNPFRELINSKLSSMTAEQKNQIKTVLNGYLSSISDATQISFINYDINKLG